ncbi:MAG: anaerobic ribonucleoside-triphosphate reductase activating protein [Elusimicrobium sp.]|jgi:pyruvate formate lyase activating enzyme|nr:anaerobic ribonucleoside-triphosphate reductase activating protein [Elusimicrobium sp.]
MKIGGLIKTSLVDYPGCVSAVIFTQGCNMRCAYCHNPELVYPDMLLDPYDEGAVLDFLAKRKSALDGVVITGGEPTVQPDLVGFMAKVKSMGYKIKLDTNGSMPDALEKIFELKLADCVAMDIKAPFGKYEETAGVKVDLNNISKSMALIVASGIEYEFRTTFDKSILNKEDIDVISATLPEKTRFVLQECQPVAVKPVLKIRREKI